MDTKQRTFPETTTAAGVGADRDKRISGQVSEATSKLTGAARQAGKQAMDQAMDAVSTLSSEATGSVKGILNRQVGAGRRRCSPCGRGRQGCGRQARPRRPAVSRRRTRGSRQD